MLRMDQIHVICHKAMVEGRSIRSVARELGVSRNTVARYVRLSEPVREESVRRPRPVMDKVAPRIDEILSEWAYRVAPKQRSLPMICSAVNVLLPIERPPFQTSPSPTFYRDRFVGGQANRACHNELLDQQY